ncbi:transglycosylase domain-containing protein [Lacticaseibacillus pantheris]|uniref:transglycosylase domain-containing protein n=1 Tax=Lacticaseibacillus pantheris TaxID=171523 RepID=UPI0026586C22|nr:transglycosylase domain-containing protein [Lacticaseibacillus pantheris]WKF85775.1 transglycosylase domain-containing protein [Lacticaseibacillus pantheris]
MRNFFSKVGHLWSRIGHRINRGFHHQGRHQQTGRSQQSEQHHDRQPVTNPLPPFSRATWTLYADTILQTIRHLVLALVAGLICAGFLALGVGVGYFASILDKTPVPSVSAMTRQVTNTEDSATLYYANNVKLATVKSDLVRESVSNKNMSPWVRKAIVATEDADFYKHNGVTPKSLLRAVISSVTGVGSQTGGSTLTQQLVKLQLLSSETTFKRKAKEIVLAMRVDKYMTKSQILNAYLNVATLGRNSDGENIAGVESAAEGIFGVSAKDLNIAQSAFIAGLPQSPFIYTPYNADGSLKDNQKYGVQREREVLFRMYRAGYITNKQYQEAKKFDLVASFRRTGSNGTDESTSGFAYSSVMLEAENTLTKQLAHNDGITTKKLNADSSLKKEYTDKAATLLTTKGYHVHTTLVKPVYEKMQSVMREYRDNWGTTHTYTYTDSATGKTETATEPVQNGSVLLDNQTGAILGFVGGVKSGINHIYSTRSSGSTIKPIAVYGPAIENQLIGSESQLADFKTSFTNYSVSDFGGTIANKFMPASYALAHSYNIPAVNLYSALKEKVNVASYIKKMGITTFTKSDYSKLGFALGGSDYGVSVKQEASAFSTFANNGQHATAYMISSITDPSGRAVYKHKGGNTKVFSKSTAYIMQKMLHGVVSSGTGTTVNYLANFDTDNLIAKTGTSNDDKDIWFIGSTPGLTMASWMGYDNNYGHSFSLGSSQSTINETYWAASMNAIYQLIPQQFKLHKTLSRPSNVKSVKVNSLTGLPNGTGTFNGKTVKTSGSTVTSLYNGWTPDAFKTEFAIGGTFNNYRLFWNYMDGANNGYGKTTSVKDDDASVNTDTTTKDQQDAAKAAAASSSSSSAAVSSSSSSVLYSSAPTYSSSSSAISSSYVTSSSVPASSSSAVSSSTEVTP